jgi:hypothetical protein
VRVGVIQSCYIPWRGYFDFIDSVDLFIVYDDVQYSKGSWRNRNQLKTRCGVRWISVPVHARLGLAVDEVRIAKSRKPWDTGHRALLTESLEPTPYFADALSLWQEGARQQYEYLSELNMRLIQIICEYLGIQTRIVVSRPHKAVGVSTVRLIDLCRKVGADTYVSGPAAKGYIEENLFAEAGIALEYKSYHYPTYPQQWGQFVGTVSVLDLIANCGSESRRYLKSLQPNEVAIS